MPTTPGPAAVVRASTWAHPAAPAALAALAASHAFNHALTLILPLGDGEQGVSEADADAAAPAGPPPAFALRASPAALASPEFASWAFPDTYGVVVEAGGAGTPGAPAAMEVCGGGADHAPPPPPPAAAGAAALAVPGCLDTAGAAALLPRGRLLLTVPASTFRRLGLPGVKLPAEGGRGAGSLGRARRGTGGSGGGAAPVAPAAPSAADPGPWYAVDTPLTGTRRAATPGGPRAKAADRLAGTAGALDWLLLSPPPPPGGPSAAAAAAASASASASSAPPPHIPGLHRVAPVPAAVARATLPPAVPPAWEAVFFGGRAPGGGGGVGGEGGPKEGPAPDPAAAADALDWLGGVVAVAGGAVLPESSGLLDFSSSSSGRGARARGGGGASTSAPAPTRLRATTWTGFLPSAFTQAAIGAAAAAVEERGLPWAAVAVSGFPHAPEAWAPRADRGDGRAVNPAIPGVRAGSFWGRATGVVVVALRGGRYGVVAAGAGPDGLRGV